MTFDPLITIGRRIRFGFSIISAVGGFCYGLRAKWPGSERVQSLVLLVVSVAILVGLRDRWLTAP